MANAKITPAHRELLITLRSVTDQTARRRILASVFKEIKAQLGIPEKHRLKVELDDTSSPNYLVIIRKKNGQKYPLGDCGRWVEAPPLPAPRTIVVVPLTKLVAILREARNDGETFAEASADLPSGVKMRASADEILIDLG